jgi:hypothetical protein
MWVKRFVVLSTAIMLLVFPIASNALAASAIEVVNEDPSAGAMFYDLVLLRPAGAVATIGGSVVFILGLPFSALGGNVGKSGEKLVANPVKYTFKRPLGKF